MDQERIFNRLSIALSESLTMVISLKSKKYEPFNALIKEFKFDEDDDKVVFSRCKETLLFPNDSEEIKNTEYMTYIKNIKSVDRHHGA